MDRLVTGVSYTLTVLGTVAVNRMVFGQYEGAATPQLQLVGWMSTTFGPNACSAF